MNKPLSHRDYNPKENFFKNIKNSRIDCNSCSIYTHGLRIEKSPNVVCALRERGDEEMVRILQMVTWAKLKWHVRMWSSPTPTFLGSHVPTIHTHTIYQLKWDPTLLSCPLCIQNIQRLFWQALSFFSNKIRNMILNLKPLITQSHYIDDNHIFPYLFPYRYIMRYVYMFWQVFSLIFSSPHRY